jgi:hypothetical protein
MVTRELSFEDVSNTIRSFYEGMPTLNVLWDLSSANTDALSSEQVKQIATLLQKLRREREGGKTALVSPGNSTFGLARMLVMLLDVIEETYPVKMKVFREIEKAIQWLSEEE